VLRRPLGSSPLALEPWRGALEGLWHGCALHHGPDHGRHVAGRVDVPVPVRVALGADLRALALLSTMEQVVEARARAHTHTRGNPHMYAWHREALRACPAPRI
jgi:hypothetical protein